jgi:hypothetical protein
MDLRGCDCWCDLRGIVFLGRYSVPTKVSESANVPAKSFGPSYGELRLDPEWDSLRGDPRFEKIVASPAPKKR